MKAPCGVEIEVGQKWQEMDGRFKRIVTVHGWIDGDDPEVIIRGIRLTKAKLSRFDGKCGGYALVGWL